MSGKEGHDALPQKRCKEERGVPEAFSTSRLKSNIRGMAGEGGALLKDRNTGKGS